MQHRLRDDNILANDTQDAAGELIDPRFRHALLRS